MDESRTTTSRNVSPFNNFRWNEPSAAARILHAVGIGSFSRMPSGPRLFYLKFRI